MNDFSKESVWLELGRSGNTGCITFLSMMYFNHLEIKIGSIITSASGSGVLLADVIDAMLSE